MLKQLFQALLLGVFMGLVPIGCCKDELREFANVRTVTLILAEPAGSAALANGARTTAPELLTAVRWDFDYVAAAPVGAPFASQAVAWSCEEPGRRGLQDKVAAVAFTSTGLFNGVAPGQSLEQYVRCSSPLDAPAGAEFPLSQLPDSLNAWKLGDAGKLRYPLHLRISPKPRDNAQHQFQLRLQFRSGRVVAQTTSVIRWE